ncbi:TPA: hypothetical protein OQU49_004425, partial [Shigella flexneri]|nr:hypothetical protein [Shigella flexneri]
DPVTGVDVPTSVPVYEGRGKLQSYEGYEAEPESGGARVTVQRMSLHLPVGAFAMVPGDVATVTASTDGLLIGRAFRLTQVAPYKEHATAYRVFVEEVTG